MSNLGQGGFSFTSRETPAGVFPAGSADNGLSIDPGSGHIVLGNDIGGTAATLLSNRRIPCDTFLIIFDAPEGHIIIRPVSNGSINQFDLINNRNNDSIPGTFIVQDGNLFQNVSIQVTGSESTIILDSDTTNSTGIGRISFQTGAVEQFTIRAGDTLSAINGLTIEKTIVLAGIKIFPSGRVFIGVTTPNPVDSGTAQLQIGGSLITAAGAPLTVAPVPIRFGGLVVAAAVLDATRYVEFVHNGVLLKFALIV